MLTSKCQQFKGAVKDDKDNHDVLIFINDGITNKHFISNCMLRDQFHKAIDEFAKINPSIAKEVTVAPFTHHPCGRFIYSPICSLNKDGDDVRRVYEAAVAGVEKAIKLGCKRPLIAIGDLTTAPNDAPWSNDSYLQLNVVMGAYFAAYQPLEVREAFPERKCKLELISFYNFKQDVLDTGFALEEGRRVTRDIIGSDPERMSAPAVAEYLKKEFEQHADCVKLTVDEVSGKKYPLMAAVNRAAQTVARHAGRVIKMEYVGSAAQRNLFLVGKGIIYDTGGADVKCNGVMAGMHRDKGGAAAVAGFMKVLALLKPKELSVHAKMAYVRNSIGEDCYVADEIITSRAGVRVRIGNTDAEGRMVMTDLLCEAKEEALGTTNPHLFTFATLTGHVIKSFGTAYAGVMDNGPARKEQMAQSLQKASDLVSDPCEISTIRREDFEFNETKLEYEDILQCNNMPSSQTCRGHQIAPAFMIVASGLDKHSVDSDKPLPYTHVDIAGSAGMIHTMPTASPVLMFAARFLMPNMESFKI